MQHVQIQPAATRGGDNGRPIEESIIQPCQLFLMNMRRERERDVQSGLGDLNPLQTAQEVLHDLDDNP